MIHATWMNGRAIPEQQVDWPDGSVVYLSRTPLPEGIPLKLRIKTMTLLQSRRG